MDKIQITLEITFDSTKGHPYHWDWATLLDLPDREHVKIVEVHNG